MRFRLMYLFSFILSAVAMWFFRNDAVAMGIVRGLSGVLINLGVVLSLCFIAMTVLGSGASLRRTRKYGITIAKSMLWTLVAGIAVLVLSFIAGETFITHSDFSMPMKTASLVELSPLADAAGGAGFLKAAIGMPQLVYFGVLFAFVLFMLFSYYLNPDLRVIQPAYALANSMNEVGFRFFYTVCNVYIVFLFVIFGAFFSRILDHSSEIMMVISSSTGLLVKMGVFYGVICLVVFPILFMLFTKFKQNPLPVIWSALITSLVSVSSGNLLFSVPVMEEIHRHQNNSLKRTTVVAGDIMYLFSRACSASLSYLAIVSLIRASAPESLSAFAQLMLLGLCFGFSLLSGAFPGMEYLFIVAAIKFVMPELISDHVMTFSAAYVPMLSIFGLFADTFAINFGTKACDIPIVKSSENS